MYDLKNLPGTMRAQITGAGLPLKTIGTQFSDLDHSPVMDEVQEWLENVRNGHIVQSVGEANCGVGLILAGEAGHGKTTLAATALQEIVMTMPRSSWGTSEEPIRRPVFFMDYPKLLRLQKSQWAEYNDETQTLLDGIYGDGPKENLVRVFVLDDLGKEHRTASGWAENTFDALLRSRFNAGLPTIVTTNVAFENWGGVYGEPMGSFAHEAFIPLTVTSTIGDRRK